MDALHIRIRQARQQKKMTQIDLAAAVGVSRSAVGNWEVAEQAAPCIEHLVAIANATGVSCDWLTSGNGQPCTATCDASRSPVMAQNCTERQVLLAFRNNPSRMRKEVLRLLDIQVAASAS